MGAAGLAGRRLTGGDASRKHQDGAHGRSQRPRQQGHRTSHRMQEPRVPAREIPVTPSRTVTTACPADKRCGEVPPAVGQVGAVRRARVPA
ncbi:hypothetical protein GCM10017567_14970 [Amycolatopsis bullii]|uniref:Uncharacterized protein n=1 Tax=Amycolatopsis bullii TaxID=941987 RepID=A0ABQ3K769_9PSEU|nr:hypothetical protein GCM10017567_14970 [Amycolatopsis bullii]